MRKTILFFLLVVPGILGIGLSAYWAAIDNTALNQAEIRFQQLAQQGAGERELFIAAHRENIHRLNVTAEGIWLALAFILTGMGVIGISLDRHH